MFLEFLVPEKSIGIYKDSKEMSKLISMWKL